MMRLFVSILVAGSLLLHAQNPPKKAVPNEEDELRQSMGEAGSSPLEIIRALERHLAKFPESKNRLEIERALVRASIDARDSTRILKYGETYLGQGKEKARAFLKENPAITAELRDKILSSGSLAGGVASEADAAE